MRRATGSAIAVLIAALVVACTAFEEPNGTPGTDGGTTAEGGPGAGDASVDGGTCAPKPSGCANAVAFHAFDFTSTTIPPAEFRPEAENGGVTHTATGNVCSPGGALHAETTVPGETGSTAQAVITRRLDGKFSNGRLAFSFRGPKPLTEAYANVGCAVTVRPAATPNIRTATRIALSDNRLVLGGSARDATDTTIASVKEIELDGFVTDEDAALWHHIEMVLTMTPDAMTVTAIFDGKPLPPYDLPILETVARIDLDCGILYSDKPGAKYSVDIDDVLIELCP